MKSFNINIKSKTHNKKSFYLILFLVICLFISCGAVKKRTSKTPKKKYPDMIQENYTHYIYKNKKKYLYAEINYAEFYEKKNTIECLGLYAEIYNAKGELTTKIKSVEGIIDKKEKNVLFNGNVEFELLENETILYSDKIVLDYKKNKLTTDKEVLILKDDGSYVKSTSLESDIKKEETKFENMEIKYYYEEDEDEDETSD